MDGLARSIGDGISGLIGGALAAVTAALAGIGDALATALPAGALPVIGVAALVVVLWLILRR